MKITCPECLTPFDIPMALLPPGGRRVRCSNCGHVWVQEAELETPRFGGFRAMEQDDDIDPIPASVHPRDDEDDDDGEGGGGNINWGFLGKVFIGFVLALAILVGAAYGLAQIGKVPAFLTPLAEALGVSQPAKGAGLEISDVNARVSNNVTVVTGKVTNTTEAELALPVLEIVPVDPTGVEGEGKRITLPQESLKAGENMTFGTELQGVLEADGTLKLRFIN